MPHYKRAENKVICYFSAGSYEPFRSDAGSFSEAILGKVLSGFEDEKWLDIRDAGLLDIMAARLDLAVQKGCDGIEPDNMDGYQNDSGFPLRDEDQLAFNRAIANLAHTRGLALLPFIHADKPVWNAEYKESFVSDSSEICTARTISSGTPWWGMSAYVRARPTCMGWRSC